MLSLQPSQLRRLGRGPRVQLVIVCAGLVWGPGETPVVALLWVRRVLVAAYDAFGSASCSELAEIAILCLLGMIASLLVLTPGDQTFHGLLTICQLLAQCG